MIPIVGLYGILAASFTIGRMLLDYVPPFFLIGIRMIVAGLLLLIMQYCINRTLSIKRQDIPLFLCISVVHIFIPYITEFFALQTIAPSCAALIFNLSPCFTAFFSYVFFHEIMTAKKWLGFIIAMSGVWYMIHSLSINFCMFQFNWNILYLLISVIFGAFGWILVRILLQRGYLPLHVNGFAMMIGGILSLGCSMVLEPTVQLPWGHIQTFILLLMAIILISNIIFYNLYSYLLRYYSATLLSFIGFVTPLYTALYDWMFLGISVDSSFYIAVIIVAYGIYLFYQEELRQGYI